MKEISLTPPFRGRPLPDSLDFCLRMPLLMLTLSHHPHLNDMYREANASAVVWFLYGRDQYGITCDGSLSFAPHMLIDVLQSRSQYDPPEYCINNTFHIKMHWLLIARPL